MYLSSNFSCYYWCLTSHPSPILIFTNLTVLVSVRFSSRLLWFLQFPFPSFPTLSFSLALPSNLNSSFSLFLHPSISVSLFPHLFYLPSFISLIFLSLLIPSSSIPHSLSSVSHISHHWLALYLVLFPLTKSCRLFRTPLDNLTSLIFVSMFLLHLSSILYIFLWSLHITFSPWHQTPRSVFLPNLKFHPLDYWSSTTSCLPTPKLFTHTLHHKATPSSKLTLLTPVIQVPYSCISPPIG